MYTNSIEFLTSSFDFIFFWQLALYNIVCSSVHFMCVCVCVCVFARAFSFFEFLFDHVCTVFSYFQFLFFCQPV